MEAILQALGDHGRPKRWGVPLTQRERMAGSVRARLAMAASPVMRAALSSSPDQSRSLHLLEVGLSMPIEPFICAKLEEFALAACG